MRLGKNGKTDLKEVMRPDMLKEETAFLSSGICKNIPFLSIGQLRNTQELLSHSQSGRALDSRAVCGNAL